MLFKNVQNVLAPSWFCGFGVHCGITAAAGIWQKWWLLSLDPTKSMQQLASNITKEVPHSRSSLWQDLGLSSAVGPHFLLGSQKQTPWNLTMGQVLKLDSDEIGGGGSWKRMLHRCAMCLNKIGPSNAWTCYGLILWIDLLAFERAQEKHGVRAWQIAMAGSVTWMQASVHWDRSCPFQRQGGRAVKCKKLR